ncbi:unnamed protein product [Caenorhabditis bovis]|uniref:Essential MCU regulator, mitochondrial n=1 Tax=Caenorhabditis bovis TaxID=2654633 RepID=A0A8S1EN60_9PELO|nr:unnamed protein product [Caenorhabditis bovis]
MSGGTNTNNFQEMAKGLIKFAVQSLSNTRSAQQTSVQRVGAGNIASMPFSNRAGLLKLFFVCGSSLWLGGLIAHKGASYLEENEIFVPAEDDDDD